jgi:Lysylphosphatidylglycerol synthase TM region
MPIVRLNKNIEIIGNSKRRLWRVFPAYILGPLVFLVLVYFIYRQVIRQPNWRGSLDQVGQAIRGAQQWKLWVVLALMPVNWGIEARKWQLVIRRAGGISYGDAFKAILTGTTFASFTPNRMGEYLGRILYVKEGRRLDSISLTIVCSIAQLMVTLLVGMMGLLYLRNYLHLQYPKGQQPLQFWLNVLLVLVLVFWTCLTIIYFRLSGLLWILRKVPLPERYRRHIKIIENFEVAILLRILFLSFGRYAVFIMQYGLVFPVFGVFLGVGQLWAGVSVVFLVMAVIPTLTFLTELGLRWGASIQVLQFFSANTVGIFAASFAIWLINLIIPALIGSLLILSIKLFKNR